MDRPIKIALYAFLLILGALLLGSLAYRGGIFVGSH
jgi:hypothetical protein